jgi:hypothetical protein
LWRGAVLFERFDLAIRANTPAFENVCPKPAPVSQRLQHILLYEILEISAGFTESVTSTDGVSDTKTLADKMVEAGVTSDDIPPVFAGTEFDICLALNAIDCFSLDKRYAIAIGPFLIRPPCDEGSRLNSAKIAVAFTTTTSNGFDITLLDHLDLGLWGRKDAFDSPTPFIRQNSFSSRNLFRVSCKLGVFDTRRSFLARGVRRRVLTSVE